MHALRCRQRSNHEVDPKLWTNYPGVSVKTDSLDKRDERGTDPRLCRPPWGEKEAGEKVRQFAAAAESPHAHQTRAGLADGFSVTVACHSRIRYTDPGVRFARLE
jgi:hypothetical protein